MAKVTIMNEIDILKQSLINAPIIWKGDYPYFIHPITDGVPRLEPDVLKAVIELSVPLIDWQSVDLILGIEAMGLPLMAPLSMRTGIPMVIARKRQYGLKGEIEINQETGYSKGSIFLNDIKQGENLVIIDDVLSTGGTIKSVIEGVKKTGAVIQNIVVVVEKGPGMATLQKDYPEISFDSLVKLEMDGGKVVIIE